MHDEKNENCSGNCNSCPNRYDHEEDIMQALIKSLMEDDTMKLHEEMFRKMIDDSSIAAHFAIMGALSEVMIGRDINDPVEAAYIFQTLLNTAPPGILLDVIYAHLAHSLSHALKQAEREGTLEALKYACTSQSLKEHMAIKRAEERKKGEM